MLLKSHALLPYWIKITISLHRCILAAPVYIKTISVHLLLFFLQNYCFSWQCTRRSYDTRSCISTNRRVYFWWKWNWDTKRKGKSRQTSCLKNTIRKTASESTNFSGHPNLQSTKRQQLKVQSSPMTNFKIQKER